MFTRICMTVGSASYTTGLFQVPLEAARNIAPDDYFQVAEIFPEMAVFFIGTGEFRDSGIGAYREMYVGFYTENREQEEAPTRDSNFLEFTQNESKMYMWKNWVTTTAATDKMDVAGSSVFRLGRIERGDGPSATTFSMEHDDEGAIQFSCPRESEHAVSDFQMKRTHYGRLHGEPSRCTLDLNIKKMATSPGLGQLKLEGKIAEECASLHLPEEPLVAIWIDEMSFDMQKPVLLPAKRQQG